MKVQMGIAKMLEELRAQSHGSAFVIICPDGTFKAMKREDLLRDGSWPTNSKLEMLREILSDEYSHLLKEPNHGMFMGVPIVELGGVEHVAVVALDTMQVTSLTDAQFADMLELL